MAILIAGTGQSKIIGSSKVSAKIDTIVNIENRIENINNRLKFWNCSNIRTNLTIGGNWVVPSLGSNPFEIAPSIVDGYYQYNTMLEVGLLLAENNPTEEIYVVLTGRGGTPSSYWYPGNSEHIRFRDNLLAALDTFKNSDPDLRVKTIVIDQGEGNHNNIDGVQFSKHWKAFVNNLRNWKSITYGRDTQFIFIPPGPIQNPYNCIRSNRRTDVLKFKQDIFNCDVIGGFHINYEDRIHFDGLGHIIAGSQVYSKIT